MRKKRPAPRVIGNGAAGAQIRLLGELYGDSSTTPPPVHPALCRSCGIQWNRPADRPWATLCLNCWRWSLARRHVRAARKLVEGGR